MSYAYQNRIKKPGSPRNSSENLGTADKLLLSVLYYDDKARVIESVSDHNLGGIDRVRNVYSFSSELTQSTRSHTASGITTTITDNYMYDHVGRRLGTSQQINAQSKVQLSKLEYNEIGQLKTNA